MAAYQRLHTIAAAANESMSSQAKTSDSMLSQKSSIMQRIPEHLHKTFRLSLGLSLLLMDPGAEKSTTLWAYRYSSPDTESPFDHIFGCSQDEQEIFIPQLGLCCTRTREFLADDPRSCCYKVLTLQPDEYEVLSERADVLRREKALRMPLETIFSRLCSL